MPACPGVWPAMPCTGEGHEGYAISSKFFKSAYNFVFNTLLTMSEGTCHRIWRALERLPDTFIIPHSPGCSVPMPRPRRHSSSAESHPRMNSIARSRTKLSSRMDPATRDHIRFFGRDAFLSLITSIFFPSFSFYTFSLSTRPHFLSINPSNGLQLSNLAYKARVENQYRTCRMSLKQGLVSLPISYITPLAYVVQEPPIGVHPSAC